MGAEGTGRAELDEHASEAGGRGASAWGMGVRVDARRAVPSSASNDSTVPDRWRMRARRSAPERDPTPGSSASAKCARTTRSSPREPSPKTAPRRFPSCSARSPVSPSSSNPWCGRFRGGGPPAVEDRAGRRSQESSEGCDARTGARPPSPAGSGEPESILCPRIRAPPEGSIAVVVTAAAASGGNAEDEDAKVTVNDCVSGPKVEARAREARGGTISRASNAEDDDDSEEDKGSDERPGRSSMWPWAARGRGGRGAARNAFPSPANSSLGACDEPW